jgi:hypothetical protein
MPRRDFDDDDDDRPRPRPRRRYEDDEDDYYEPPRRRRRPPAKSNPVPLIVGLAIGGVFLLSAISIGAYFVVRAANRPAPPAMANAGAPPINNMPGLPVGPAPPGPPAVGMPGGPGLPAAPGNWQVTISNLRVQAGFAGRSELAFDYQFANGRPIGAWLTAVITEPGGQQSTADLHFLEQQGTISLRSFGPFGGNFASGTRVFIANHVIGIHNNPSPISNTLTLP